LAHISRQLRDAVRARAGGKCEYCRVPEAFYQEPFWIDHIIAEQHGGQTIFENLAFACMRCNRHKGPNLSGRDPLTDSVAILFNPRTDVWHDHFKWLGPMLTGKTPGGRATIIVLDINNRFRVATRSALIEEGVFPE
jgi:hypothetical protein